MTRGDVYFIDEWEVIGKPTLVEEEENLFSGLYDAEGLPLYRESKKIKMGFDLGD